METVNLEKPKNPVLFFSGEPKLNHGKKGNNQLELGILKQELDFAKVGIKLGEGKSSG